VSLASIPSVPADLELIAQLKIKLQYAELRIRVLEERLRLMRIEKYGAGGEKLSQAQMQLFELAPVVSEIVVQAESEHAPVHRSTNRALRPDILIMLRTDWKRGNEYSSEFSVENATGGARVPGPFVRYRVLAGAGR
jgi:hypothetical protein